LQRRSEIANGGCAEESYCTTSMNVHVTPVGAIRKLTVPDTKIPMMLGAAEGRLVNAEREEVGCWFLARGRLSSQSQATSNSNKTRDEGGRVTNVDDEDLRIRQIIASTARKYTDGHIDRRDTTAGRAGMANAAKRTSGCRVSGPTRRAGHGRGR